MRARLAGSIAAAVLFTAPAAASQAQGCAGAHATAKRSNVAKVARATACLINKQRARHGLKPLHVNGRLAQAAAGFSALMVSDGFFDHIAPDGTSPVDRAMATHYLKPGHAWFIAENIGIVSSRRATAAKQVADWMHSPEHRANILTSDARDAGIGVAIGNPLGGAGATYTLDVGRAG